MRIEDLMEITKRSRKEVEDMLSKDDVISLDLTEK